MKKLRILMLNYEFPPLGGGGGVAAKKLALGFIQNGYDVDYVTTWFKDLKEYEIINGINVYRVKVPGRKDLQTATMLSLISFPLYARAQVKKLCEKYQYEFINTHFAIPTGPLGIWASRKYNLTNILSIHGGDIYDPTKKNSPHNKWHFGKVVQWTLNNSNILVAQSSNTKENTIKYYHPKKEIKIIPLPYESFKFKKASRKALGMKSDLFYIVSVGRLVKRKGYDFLIKSLSKLNNPKVQVLIIGDGPEKDSLINLAKDLNLSNQVNFLGQVEEEKKFQYLSNSDLYVLSSVHEGFGIVLQEAMQVNLPIIATDNGGQVDLVKSSDLVKHGDTNALVNKMEKAIKNSKHLKSNSNMLKQYLPINIANKYIELVK